MLKNFFTALFFLFTLALTSKADEQVQLKQKTYEQRKKIDSAQLGTRPYQSADARNIKTKQAKTSRKGWWNVFRSEKPAPVTAPFSGAAPAASLPLRQDKQISAATMKAVPPSATEKKPYETGVSKTVKPYTPDNRPRPKNPLLRPRQNIKEPQ